MCGNGLLRATRDVDTPRQRTVGLIWGASGLLGGVILLVLLLWLLSLSLGQDELSSIFQAARTTTGLATIVYLLVDPILISLGIGLADHYVTRNRE